MFPSIALKPFLKLNTMSSDVPVCFYELIFTGQGVHVSSFHQFLAYIIFAKIKVELGPTLSPFPSGSAY